MQRNVSVRDVLKGTVRSANIDTGVLKVDWSDDHHTSEISLNELFSTEASSTATPQPQPWTQLSLREALPSISFIYDEVMTSPQHLKAAVASVFTRGVALIEGVPSDTSAPSQSLCERFGVIRNTNYGAFWEFGADMAFTDTAYTTEALPLHTDGTYLDEPPGVQMFHCVLYDATGGHTLLSDGLTAATNLRNGNPAAFETLLRVALPWHYVDSATHYRAVAPILRADGSGRIVDVRFNNCDRAPFYFPPPETEALYDALAAWEEELARPSNVFELLLKPGVMLLVDNRRVLHARTSFSGRRKMVGCYMNRGEFESKWRVLGGAVQAT